MVEIRKIALNDISPNNGQIPGVPKNPRKISKQQFKLLMKSLEDDPYLEEMKEIWVKPMEDGTYVAVDGNMRVRAHKKLGHQECLCKIIPDDWTPTQIKTAILKANTTFGDWDEELLSGMDWEDVNFADCGLDLPDMEKPTEEKEVEDDNYEPLPPKVPVTKPGDMYKLGEHYLLCGDSTDPMQVAKVMQGELADLWLTDPPYNVNYAEKEKSVKDRTGHGNVHEDIANDNMDSESFLHFLTDAFTAAANSMQPGAAFYIWHASTEVVNFITATREAGLLYKQMLFWNKTHFVLGRQDYQNKHEPCLYGWKEGAGHYFTCRRDMSTVLEKAAEMDLEKMSKAELKELVQKMLSYPTTVIDEKKPNACIEHPTMKPIPLFGRLIVNSTREHDIVLDTFGGSGTTLIACEQLGRKCRIMELSPEYCDVIVDRWEAWTGEKAIKL